MSSMRSNKEIIRFEEGRYVGRRSGRYSSRMGEVHDMGRRRLRGQLPSEQDAGQGHLHLQER